MKNKLKLGGYLAIVAGLILIVGGVWGICFTYKNVAQENIVTGEDASIPNEKVLGPLTLKSQADIIREHTLKITEGKTYAEMPRFIEKKDDKGNVVLDKEGKAVLIENAARNIWITATSLTTAINLAIMSYAFSALIILFGLVSLFTGYLFLELSKKN